MTMDWQAQEEARRAWMDQNSLYREEDEHSSCGVGFVVDLDGKGQRGRNATLDGHACF